MINNNKNRKDLVLRPCRLAESKTSNVVYCFYVTTTTTSREKLYSNKGGIITGKRSSDQERQMLGRRLARRTRPERWMSRKNLGLQENK